MWRILSGIWMGWGLGANDAANIFGPAVSAKIIRYRTATLLIGIFVILGAWLEGPKCMSTLGKLANLSSINEAFIILLSSALCVTIMSYWGFPVSTSQAVVGAIIGNTFFGQIAANNYSLSAYAGLGKIVLCWVGTPFGAMFISWILYHVVNYISSRYIKNIIMLNQFITVSLIVSGCYGAYSLGANNVANAMGVYVKRPGFEGLLTAEQAAVFGGIAIAVGAITFSYKVMETVGEKITVLGPLGALVAVTSNSLTVHFYTQLGVPVSSSQAIVGAVIGIGLIKGARTLGIRKIVNIVLSWIFTPLSAGIFTLFILYVSKTFSIVQF